MAEKKRLTVVVEAQWIDAAKEYARRHNTSLSRLISAYLRGIALHQESPESGPILCRLAGILPTDVSRCEYRSNLEENHCA